LKNQLSNKQKKMPNLKVMLITGCASGIGCHLAKTFYKEGHKIIATDIELEKLQAIAKAENWAESRVLLLPLDVRNHQQWQTTFDTLIQKWGRLDVLINNAGVMRSNFIHEIDLSEIDLHLDINTKGVMLGAHLAAKQMIKQSAGHIINIASLAGIAPLPGESLYCASKFAIRGFTFSIAYELKQYGIAVTAISPDAVDTPLLENTLDSKAAALNFTANSILTPAHVEKAVQKALKKRPIEITLPMYRTWMAIVVSAAPNNSLIGSLKERMWKKGERKQAKLAAIKAKLAE